MRRRRTVPFVLSLAAAVLLAAGAARGDEIVTRSGTKYQGRIVSEDSTHYVIETTDLGTMRVAKADVAKVNRPEVAGTKSPAPAEKPDPKPAPKEDAPAAGSPQDGAAAPQGSSGDDDDAAKEAQPDPEEEARKQAEQAALDAAARLARRKAATMRRRTDPGAEKAEAPEEPAPTEMSEKDIQREKERDALASIQFNATEPGSQVIVFEPARPFAAAPSGVQLGRRTWARFDAGGASMASLTVTVADKPERLALRLTDVQRHILVQSDSSRVRLFEGVDADAWLRIRMDDGTTTTGRFASVDDEHAHLVVPAADGTPSTVDVDVAHVVQMDGLVPTATVTRTLADLEPGEPVGIVLWPQAKEIVGRFVDRMEHAVRIDQDGDGEPETILATDAPIADVRRIPVQWRATARALHRDSIVRVRGFEEFPDARVERVFTAPVASVTAYAISVQLDDGCAVVPFASLVALEDASRSDAAASARHLERAAVELPVLPGTAASEAQSKTLPSGLSFISDGRAVTHVYVAAPYDRNVCGLRVGTMASEVLAYAEVNFGIEVMPKGGDPAERRREMISETVEGLRITAYVDARGTIGALEITQR